MRIAAHAPSELRWGVKVLENNWLVDLRPFVRRALLLLVAVPVLAVHAQTQADIDAAARQADFFQRQLQERLQQEQDRARKAVPPVGGADLRQTPETTASPSGAACRQIDALVIEGGERLRQRTVMDFSARFVGRCIGVVEIEQILAGITADYIEQGYITTRAYLPAQDLGSGRLNIVVVEGVIEGYRLEGEDAQRILVPGAFPGAPGDRLNLRDLEQGIDQINRLAANQATMEVVPGSKSGQSIVVIRNKRSLPVHLFTSYDNMGSESTGKHAYALTATLDSPLGLNERWMVTRRHSQPHDNEHDSGSDAFDFWVPVGNWSLGFNASRSTYVNVLQLASGTKVHTNGETRTQSLTLDRLAYRDQASKLTLFSRVSLQDARNYMMQQLIEVNSRKLASAEFGANGFLLAGGGVINAQAVYAQGLKAFGALQDADDSDRNAPRAQFRKLNLDLGFNRPFSLLKLPLNWSNQLHYQYAQHPLYGSQQIQIGGIGSVRGFMRNSIAGDRGFYLRNELAWPWQFALGGESWRGRMYGAYDTGYVHGIVSGTPKGQLSGATIGLSAQWRGAAWEFYNSRPVDVPDTWKKEAPQTWFRISYAF